MMGTHSKKSKLRVHYITSFERCHRKFSKRIECLSQLTYNERLFGLGLTTLLERRFQGDRTETFKILDGI